MPVADTTSATKQLHFYIAGALVAAGYFNGHRDFLDVGDFVRANCSDNQRMYKISTVPADDAVTVAAIAQA